MSVVFDGRPLDNFPDGSRFRGVPLFYARRGSNADNRIIELIEESRNRHNLRVVTSDSALIRRVEAAGVKTMRSGEFRKKLDSVTRERPSQPEVREEEMGTWLRYFGVDDDDDSDDDFAP
jgi:predicted RNA-binding protein with PIN domain